MGITTDQLANQLHLKPQSLRAALSREGHYFGLRPRKLPNGRLIWPDDAVQRLVSPRVLEKGAEQ
ncbi:DNA-binding protein [Zoogloea sp.]|uniref:DNA-binding protein n=1 Tax=Zoogloea sp. TaxID=49181 RepID=UPI002606BB8E|nr:DNA-binding protein [uncultured Zoogloea sp.]